MKKYFVLFFLLFIFCLSFGAETLGDTETENNQITFVEGLNSPAFVIHIASDNYFPKKPNFERWVYRGNIYSAQNLLITTTPKKCKSSIFDNSNFANWV